VISCKLKTATVIIIFLLLLILDIPEFIICMSIVPDEILDVPCLLVRGNMAGDDTNADKLLMTISKMLETYYCLSQKKKPTGFNALSDICCTAEIKRHYLYGGDNRQYEDNKEINLIREINRPITSIEKSNQISSILRTPILSVLKI